MAKKQVIRLTEGDLRRIIKESVKLVLNESKYPNPMGGIEDRINAYPEYAKDFDNENPLFPIPNKERLHTLNRLTDAWGSWEPGDNAYYDDGEVYPSGDFTSKRRDFSFPNDADAARNFLAQKDFNKKWNNMLDKIDYSKKADSRPLHRKGSLNREL